MKSIMISFLLIFCAASMQANMDHSSWNKLLQKHVSADGKVNYQGFQSDISSLNTYLQTISAQQTISSWSKDEQLAFWMNAYNAFTIKLILNHLPVKSIMDIDGGKAWDRSWIKIGNKTYTLNEIEHDVIRPQFKDARIHFAVNCAARSCPTLHNEAFNAANVQNKLAFLTKAFINNKSFNQISNTEMKVSKIFDWYQSDFGEVADFINKYSDTKSNASPKFLDYNWALND